MRAEDAARELVNRMLQSVPLLPLPGASQDLSMLAWRIERQDAALLRVRQLAQELDAENPDTTVRANHVADEILAALEGGEAS